MDYGDLDRPPAKPGIIKYVQRNEGLLPGSTLSKMVMV